MTLISSGTFLPAGTLSKLIVLPFLRVRAFRGRVLYTQSIRKYTPLRGGEPFNPKQNNSAQPKVTYSEG
ncbi:hypothetical protein GCM10023151_17320 [Kangiella marina]|uniref:Uncharacterized protein n=1 Tax=Kangiella marina TaxID=1079178 RepID=A0ABP8IMH3_9GAMM